MDEMNESPEAEKAPKAPSEVAQNFLDLIKAREKEFENTWWKRAEETYRIYAAPVESTSKFFDDVPYNILYSNTEVLAPSLYSAIPKPDVRTRFKDKPQKPMTDLLSKFLGAAADTVSPGLDSLDAAMNDMVLSGLVPGMGYIRLRKKDAVPFPITYESGHYKTLIWGKAPRWSKVPWIAFRHFMHKEQMFAQFKINDADAAAGYSPTSEADDEKDQCCVYEVWDRKTKKVYFISEEWSARELIEPADDPLGLVGFFPTPGPLIFTARPGKLQAGPLYDYYRNQAEELNRVTVRLNKVLSAIKVRGAYNSLLGDDLKTIFSSDTVENELIAAQESGMLAQNGGFDKHIWMVPIEKLITVASELYKAREAIKQVIYEITGISDIIRGSSVASETATAQDLKNKWGTVRLRKMQTLVANYARDVFRMTVDAGLTAIPADQWKKITQTEFPLESEKVLAQQQMVYLQSMQPPLPMPIPGQPPAPPPQPDPEMERLKGLIATPSLESVLESLKSDLDRSFIVNIQTSSTIDLDTAQDKAEVGEFMNSMGQLLAGIQPLQMYGQSGLDAIKEILIAVTQRYKFGLDLGDTLSKLQQPPPPPPETPAGPTPEEQQVIQEEAQLKLAKIAADKQILQAETELAMAKIAQQKQQLSIDIELAQLRLAQQKAKVASNPAPAGQPLQS